MLKISIDLKINETPIHLRHLRIRLLSLSAIYCIRPVSINQPRINHQSRTLFKISLHTSPRSAAMKSAPSFFSSAGAKVVVSA